MIADARGNPRILKNNTSMKIKVKTGQLKIQPTLILIKALVAAYNKMYVQQENRN